jgi:hypothetical protein
VTKFADLPVIEAPDYHHAWDFFGSSDELGSLNRLTPTALRRAARLVRQGKVLNLNLPLDKPEIDVSGLREPYVHHVHGIPGGRDDYLDRFYLQRSSHWDGLKHVRFKKYGYYGGRQGNADEPGLGIDVQAGHGIVGRGLLLDVARHGDLGAERWDPSEPIEITPELLESVAHRQSVEDLEGDILIIRTGWLEWYLQTTHQSDEPDRKIRSAGLSANSDMAEWLWDHKFVAVAADNPAVEVLPNRGGGFLHSRALVLLGILFGECWSLRDAADDCERDGTWEGLLVSCPLSLPGGVGSPANAYLIK